MKERLTTGVTNRQELRQEENEASHLRFLPITRCHRSGCRDKQGRTRRRTSAEPGAREHRAK